MPIDAYFHIKKIILIKLKFTVQSFWQQIAKKCLVRRDHSDDAKHWP